MKFNQAGDVIEHPKLGKGEWLVVATQMAGGSHGGGMNGHDDYPNGHQLVLRQLIPGTHQDIAWTVNERRFFQSGSFIDTSMLPYLTPIRRLSTRFTRVVDEK